MLYIYMLGYDVDFGHMEAVSLISAPKYPEKQVVLSVYDIFLLWSVAIFFYCQLIVFYDFFWIQLYVFLAGEILGAKGAKSNFFSIFTAGWVHCDILFTQWEPWLFEIGNKYCTQWYHWSQWNFPMSRIDYGMMMENCWSFLIFALLFVLRHITMLLVFLYKCYILYWWRNLGLVDNFFFFVFTSLSWCMLTNVLLHTWTWNVCVYRQRLKFLNVTLHSCFSWAFFELKSNAFVHSLSKLPSSYVLYK